MMFESLEAWVSRTRQTLQLAASQAPLDTQAPLEATPPDVPQSQGSDALSDAQRQRHAFVLELGQALHAYGTPAHQLEDALERVSARLGLQGQFFSTPTSILAAFGPMGDQRVSLLRVQPGVVELGKLAEIDGVAGAVLRGQCALVEGSRRLAQVVASPKRYGVVTFVLAHSVASAAAARFFNGALIDLAVASVIGTLVGLISVWCLRHRETSRVLEPLAALATALVAGVAAWLIPGLSVYVVTVASLIALVPGLTLTLAMTELATRNLVSGTARLMSAILIFLELGFGVALGQQIAALLGAAPAMPAALGALPWWTEALSLVIAPLAFAVLFDARRRDLLPILGAGITAYLGARAGGVLFGPQLGACFGALAVASLSNLAARWLDRPASVLLVPGILLLVPGSIGFKSMTAMLARDVLGGVDTAFSMILVAMAIVAGLLFANVLVPPRRAL